MPRNVEIKARVPGNVRTLSDAAEALSDTVVTILKQEDTFFQVPHGRLKLREQQEKEDFLVFYDRTDSEGPKLSDFELCVVPEATNLKSLLTRALGKLGVVRKTRSLYMVGQTRIHIDEVEGLGNFVELEVLLQDDQTVEEGQLIAHSLMKSLGISEENLLKGAYMDYILKNFAFTQ